jgi:hypothetical protein
VKCPNAVCGTVSVLDEDMIGPDSFCPVCGTSYYVPAPHSLGKSPIRFDKVDAAPRRHVERPRPAQREALKVQPPGAIERTPQPVRDVSIPNISPAPLRPLRSTPPLWWAIPVAGLLLLLMLGGSLAFLLWGKPQRAKPAAAPVMVAPELPDDLDQQRANMREKERPEKPALAPAPQPEEDRPAAATYHGSPVKDSPSVLVARKRGEETWTRVVPDRPVFADDTLLSLPGYGSELRTRRGARLLLWGTLPELNPNSPVAPYLYECAVTLHHSDDLDLDFTLDRGRVYVSGLKGQAVHFRVHFLKESWEIGLPEGDNEILLELIKRYTPDIKYQDGEEPRVDLTCYVLKGKAAIKSDAFDAPAELTGPTGQAILIWDNVAKKVTGPHRIQEPLTILGKDGADTDVARDMRRALPKVAERMTGKERVETFLREEAQAGKVATERTLSAYCLGAIDDVTALLDILAAEDTKASLERQAAVYALRNWVNRGPEMNKRLHDPKAADGLLVKKGYTQKEAETIVRLLHNFSEEARKKRETFESLADGLREKKIAVRQLAYFHLQPLSFGVKELPKYDPSWAADRLDKAAKEWEELIAKGELPPPPQPPKK